MLSRLIFLTLSLSFNMSLFAQTCNDNMLASTPDDHFILDNNGMVVDKQTGLTWRRCMEGQTGTDCSLGVAETFTWQQALLHASAQGNGWRLPNIKELASIVELRCFSPAINLNIFPNAYVSAVWSSSPLIRDSNQVWAMYFSHGFDTNYNRDTSVYVRLVRDDAR